MDDELRQQIVISELNDLIADVDKEIAKQQGRLASLQVQLAAANRARESLLATLDAYRRRGETPEPAE